MTESVKSVPTSNNKFKRQKTYAAAKKDKEGPSNMFQRQKTSHAIRTAIQSESKLPMLIATFRKVEASLVDQFKEDLKIQFVFACVTSDKIIEKSMVDDE